MRKPKQYTSVTANLTTNGNPMIIAWRNDREFDMIPMYGKSGEIKWVAPITPLTEASTDLLEALEEIEGLPINDEGERIIPPGFLDKARYAIAKATQP
jgi:hypothetical protein